MAVLAKRWLSPQEAADYTGSSVQSIRRWILAGRIPAVRLGEALVRIDRDALDELLARSPLGPPADED